MKKALLLTKSKNRMHCIAYLLAAGVLAFCCCCCNRDHSTSTPEELETGELEIEELEPGELDTWKLAHLEGTKWKLVGIVDV
ncbi:MAG: hypothetical protein LBG28_11400, partial [Tannerella sp.]|nr:hypothetical protein [Tannerella sp.]